MTAKFDRSSSAIGRIGASLATLAVERSRSRFRPRRWSATWPPCWRLYGLVLVAIFGLLRG